MNIIFMGSDELACPALQALVNSEADNIVAVVSQPDRPKGRNRRLSPCPAKALAQELSLPVLAPAKLGEEGSLTTLRDLASDLIVVAAYGQYIRGSILELPQHGAINIHPSLLPKYRGAAPIQMAIAEGEMETGVSIIDVAKEMDAGDILCQQRFPIDPDDTAASLSVKLADLGAKLLIETVDAIRSETAVRTVQNSEQATYVHKLKKEDGQIDWSLPADTIRNRVRGFNPWPGSFCYLPGDPPRSLKIWSVRIEEGRGSCGEIIELNHEGPLVATGKGALRLLRVQAQGKKAMDGGAYLRGHPIAKGLKLT